MKPIKPMAGILLGMLFTLLYTVSAFANTSKIDGNLDSIVGDSISGWAWNSEMPDSSLTVTVTVTDKKTGGVLSTLTAEANEHREDLKAKGIGTGAYGFHVQLDWDSLPASIYLVSVSAGDTVLPGTLTHLSGGKEMGLVSLGTFRTTAYCPCLGCSEGWGRHTSSGATACAGHTVAVDPRVIPIGSRLLIDGVEYVAEDIGGAVKGKHIDIFYNTHAETRSHGVRNSEVYLIV